MFQSAARARVAACLNSSGPMGDCTKAPMIWFVFAESRYAAFLFRVGDGSGKFLELGTGVRVVLL